MVLKLLMIKDVVMNSYYLHSHYSGSDLLSLETFKRHGFTNTGDEAVDWDTPQLFWLKLLLK